MTGRARNRAREGGIVHSNAEPKRWRVAAATVCVVAAAIAGIAAQPQQTPQPQTPLFRADVNVVVVEAAVVDKAGNIARGLEPADFKVEISGKAREVVSAELIEYDATGTGAIATDPDITTNLYSNSARTILVVVDQQSLRVEDRTAFNAMKRWVTSLGPGDRVGLVTLPAPGPRVEFTTNRQAVIDGLSRILPRAGSTAIPYSNRNVTLFESLRIDENDTMIRDQVIARECQALARDPACVDEVDTRAHSVALESQTHVRQVVGELVTLAQQLGRLPGPKHIVLVSSGLPTDPREAMSEMSKIAGDAALGNVMIHTFTIEPFSYTAARGRPVVRTSADEALLITGVEMLAGLTGGRTARLAGQGDGAFKALSDGLTGYYRLGVRAELDDLDGKSHRIALSVRRPGVVLTAYRRMLAGVPQKAEKPLEARAAIRAALESATPKTEVNLRATTYVMHGERGGEMRVVVVGDVGRAAAGPATAVAALYTLQGLSLTAMENAIDVPVTGSAPLSISLNAPPNAYILRLAVRDVDGRLGSLERPIEVGWRKIDGVETPGLMLFRSDDRSDSGPKPLFRAVSSAERIIAQVPVTRPAGSAAPEVVFEVTPQGGSTPIVRTAAKLATTTSGATVAREVVQAAILPPGAYTMTATIGAGGGQRLARSFVVEPAKPGETPAAPAPSAPTAAAATAPSGPAPAPAAGATAPSVRVVAGGPAPYPFTKTKFSTGAVLNPGAVTPVLVRLAERSDVAPVRESLAGLGAGPWSTDPAHGALASAPVAAEFVAGLGRLQQGDLAAAAEAFRKVLRTAPDFTPALAYLGACDAAAGKDTEAAVAWEQAITREPAASPALYRLAIQARLRAEQPAPALTLVRLARQRWPDDATFVGLYAQSIVADGRPREAVELIDGMAAADPATLLVGLEVLHEASTRKTPLWDSFRDLQTMRRLRQRYAAAKGDSLALVDGWITEMAGPSR